MINKILIGVNQGLTETSTSENPHSANCTGLNYSVF